jgi:sigma-E factor negative regulatory protein RseA
MASPTSLSDLRRSDRQALSALADGQASGSEADRAIACWARDPSLQRDWHDWHRIGDVLRSDELALPPAHDEDFLRRLRERLMHEPSSSPRQVEADTLAGSAPAVPTVRSTPAWRMPMALAAGVTAVAMGISALQWSHVEEASVAVSRAGPAVTAAASVAAQASADPALRGVQPPADRTLVLPSGPAARLPGANMPSGIEGPVIRDPDLDNVLRAQRTPAGPLAPAAGAGRVETVRLER